MSFLIRVSESAFNSDSGYRVLGIDRWNPKTVRDWRMVEKAAFRKELRYNRKELIELSGRTGFEALIIYDGIGPLAIMMAYPGLNSDSLYFDTMAVREIGTGLGGRLLNALVAEARSAGYHRVELDTENVSERGQELVGWYRKHGFKVVSEHPSGNIGMALKISG